MTPSFLWRAVLIGVVSLAVTAPVRAETLATAETQIIAGIVVVSAAIGVVATVLILHYKHKTKAITGCVTSAASGLSLLNEQDKRIYTLSGTPVGLKPGDRMTLEGKARRADNTLIFEARTVSKDFGACQP